MKRLLLVFGTAIMVAMTLTVSVSGERVASDNKKPTRIDQKRKPVQPDRTPAAIVPQPSTEPTEIEFDLPAAENAADAPADYTIPWKSINGGGGNTESATHKASVSIGQGVIGFTASADHQAGIGYWYGISPSGGCDCGSPWGDLNDDDLINPVDVVLMVNKVYILNDMLPEFPDCPLDAGDVSCDGIVNPVDVVFYVNKVYILNDLFCPDPCI